MRQSDETFNGDFRSLDHSLLNDELVIFVTFNKLICIVWDTKAARH